MTELAVIRPGEWNLPLFLHVLGGFTLVERSRSVRRSFTRTY
jgi:hypothetical protein